MVIQITSTLAKAAHCPNIVQIPDLHSQHGDLDHTQNLIICSLYHPGPHHKIL